MTLPFIFLTILCLVLFQFLWQERRLRIQRSKSLEEFQKKVFQQQKEDYARQQAQLQALFNSMIEGVLILDSNGKVQLANEALRGFFQLPRDITGQTMIEVFRLPELTALAERMQKESTVLDCDLSLGLVNPRHLQINATLVLDRSGLRQGTIFVFHDVTRLKELETMRQEFVANVSHELRTPLSLIKGFTETLLDGAKDDPEVAPRFLQNIDKHSNRLLFLIEDLLTISKLESGRVSLSLQNVDLRELTDRVFDDFEARALDKKVVLTNEVAAETVVRADASRLQQVFFNLVENAIKYGHVAGHVNIEARAVKDKVEISVTDDGPGIPPDAQPRIFERFYRVDRARSRDSGGTGLGLSIVKHIVQAHDGEVWVQSTPGKGTTFFFTLPSGND